MPGALTVIRHADRPSVTLPGGAAYQPIIGDDTGQGLPIRTGFQTSQREIETAVRDGLATGKLSQSALLKPRVTLSIPELALEHIVEGEIGLS